MTKEDDEDIENCTKCWICDNTYVAGDFKVRDHCHITGKYRSSAQRDCNINVKSNHKIPIAFYILLYQKLGKFNFKITFIPNGLENYMTFNTNKKLIFTDSVQCLILSFDTLVKNSDKADFDNKVLELVKQKGFYPYDYMSDFEKIKEEISSK